MGANVAFTVFTKPWKEMPLPELGRFVKEVGFDGVELPVRPGFQVAPEDVTEGLPAAARILGDCGVRIGSVAGPTDERTIAACAEAGVPIIRICVNIPEGQEYLTAVAEAQRQWDGLVDSLAACGVAIGVQNHCGRCVAHAMGLRRAIEKYDPGCVGAVLDFGHCGLAGELPQLALDIVWSHLRMVNFKSACWRLSAATGEGAPRWQSYWTAAREGMADWPAAVEELKKRDYQGDVCLTAEYSQTRRVDELIGEDLAFIKSLFAAGG